jgi:hypothetical protein
MALVGAGCRLVDLTEIGAFGVKGRIGFWRQPVTKAVRFKVGLFFKKRPTERCEMLETRPRRIASSAISRWLQWLIGRSLSDGFSQVIAITALGREQHSFQTVVVDSRDALEPLIWAATCADNNWQSIESVSYGKGYVEADRQWHDLLDGLDWLRRNRGMMIVLIAHSAVETVNDPRAPGYTSYQLRLHKRGRALAQDWADAIGFLSTELVISTEDQGFKKRTRADGGSARYIHWEGKPAFTAKNRYALPAKMLVAKDFDFSKQLTPYFPGTGHEHASAVTSARRRDQHNSDGARDGAGDGAGDGADRGLTRITPEPGTKLTTGEQERNDRRTET